MRERRSPLLALRGMALAVGLLLSACATGEAEPIAPAASVVTAAIPPSPYADADKWLCLPGREDLCNQDMTTTVVAADGSMTIERFAEPAPDKPIDCFYVYPTISLDPTGNADWNAGPEYKRVLEQQLVRFADVCNVYAPKYRQITMAGVAGRVPGADIRQLGAIAYGDIVDAWQHYLAAHNKGRGVILIGHSQGSRWLISLIAREIDGKPVQDRIVAAYLNGTSVTVPEGKDVGGSFQHMPLCRSVSQTGCVVAFRSFRADKPPVNSYAATSQPGMEIACVNPAAPAGGEAELHSYLTTQTIMRGPRPVFAQGKEVTTPFASVPGLLTGECVSDERGQYLAVRIKADPTDPRTDDITGDIYTDGAINPAQGLHLIDVNLVMGDLLDLARKQTAAYLE